MPPGLLITSLFILFQLSSANSDPPTTRAVAASATRSQWLEDCRDQFHDFPFDFCSLITSDASQRGGARGLYHSLNDDEDRGEGPSSMGGSYYASVARGKGFVNNAKPCDEETDDAFCILDDATTADEGLESMHIKLGRAFRTVAADTEPAIKFVNDDASVSKVNLRCSPQTGNLRYLGTLGAMRSFEWPIPEACAFHARASDIFAAQEGDSDSKDDQSQDSDEATGEDDELMENDRSKLHRRWIAVSFLILTVGGLCIYAVSTPRVRDAIVERSGKWYYYTALPFLANVGDSIKSVGPRITSRIASPFRQGEGQLVRWAQEDMGLEDSGDLMVNGGNARTLDDYDLEGWGGKDLDEYIPLTSGSIRGTSHGRRIRSYGATPDVETFAERGAIGGLGRMFGR